MSTGGPVSQFLRHHFRHFNAAALIDAAEAYRAHLEQALLICAPEARAPGAGAASMRAGGARTRGRRC